MEKKKKKIFSVQTSLSRTQDVHSSTTNPLI